MISAGKWIEQRGNLVSLNSFVTFAPFKVNRRQARQGELRSKRRSPGGEGPLGDVVEAAIGRIQEVADPDERK